MRICGMCTVLWSCTLQCMRTIHSLWTLRIVSLLNIRATNWPFRMTFQSPFDEPHSRLRLRLLHLRPIAFLSHFTLDCPFYRFFISTTHRTSFFYSRFVHSVSRCPRLSIRIHLLTHATQRPATNSDSVAVATAHHRKSWCYALAHRCRRFRWPAYRLCLYVCWIISVTWSANSHIGSLLGSIPVLTCIVHCN